jgi:hypothetical protein
MPDLTVAPVQSGTNSEYQVQNSTTTVTNNSDGSVTVTANVPRNFSFSDYNSYVLNYVNPNGSYGIHPFLDERTSAHEAQMTLGNLRLEMLDNQHKNVASASNQTITAQQLAADVAEVEKEMPGWTPELGHVYDHVPTYDYIWPSVSNSGGQSLVGQAASQQVQTTSPRLE